MESRINDDDEQITTVYYPTFLSGPFLNEEGESEETDSIDEITEVYAQHQLDWFRFSFYRLPISLWYVDMLWSQSTHTQESSSS
ncbi:hypothetical protein PS15m_007963 [Mucor circinelloides]